MKRVLSISATVFMVGIMMTTVADVLEDPPEMHQVTFEYCQQAAGAKEEIPDPEVVVMARTHNVHLYSQEDEELIKRVAEAEGLSEGADGMWMISSVIINRTHDPDYPSTVEGVIRQKNAFSSLNDGNFDKATGTSQECQEAWERIESGDVCPEIIAFESVDSDVLDQWFSEAFSYRKHKFYTKKR